MAQTVHNLPSNYGEKFTDHLIEQYKVFRGKVVDIINDRNTQTKFLFTVLTAILAGPVIYLRTLPQKGDQFSLLLTVLMLAFSIGGVVICRFWILWNKSYKYALKAAYRVLQDIEKYLPAQPFTVEEGYRDELADGDYKKTADFLIMMPIIFLVGIVFVTLCIIFVLVSRCTCTY
jgi:hypothetical protein